MLDIFTHKKTLEQQLPEDKMVILKAIATRKLGSKWEYFRKIKHAGEKFEFLKEASLMEQMKATQAALKFTARNTRKTYWNLYKETLQTIKRNTGLKTLPELPEIPEGKETPTLKPMHDGLVIQWCPIKFMLPAKYIREKGIATQRHSEGLVAKLMFKVVGYYADPANWNRKKLSNYLWKIDEQMAYKDVVPILEPLKKDLLKFAEVYETFKFGKASLQKDATQDSDAFEDAFGLESFQDEIRTLYWYHFIYQGMEQFLMRYFITLITSTNNTNAIRYLQNIFEPALSKAIENKNLFIGSFETDSSKKRYLKPYETYKKEQANEGVKKQILKTKKYEYETWVYNLPMQDLLGIRFDLAQVLNAQSEWAHFLRQQFMGVEPELQDPILEGDLPWPAGEPHPDEETLEPAALYQLPTLSPEARKYAFMELLNTLIAASEARMTARHKILEMFKMRVKSDKEAAQRRIAEIRKDAEKKIRNMERKKAKLLRMKQEKAVESFEADIEKFKQMIATKCNTIIEDSKYLLSQQKIRLQKLFDEISRESQIPAGLAGKQIMSMAKDLEPDTKEEGLTKNFVRFVTQQVVTEYRKDLEPFYANLFEVLQPTTQEKMMLAQAMDRAGGEGGVKLSLSEAELAQIADTVTKLKSKIAAADPGIFQAKIIFLSTVIPLNDLFELGLENKSLGQLLKLKITSPKQPRANFIRPATVKALMVLNMVKNPIPHYNLLQEGKEHLDDPTRVINIGMLNRLLADLHTQSRQQASP